jgi:hypothetical protein
LKVGLADLGTLLLAANTDSLAASTASDAANVDEKRKKQRVDRRHLGNSETRHRGPLESARARFA